MDTDVLAHIVKKFASWIYSEGTNENISKSHKSYLRFRQEIPIKNI